MVREGHKDRKGERELRGKDRKGERERIERE